ncbi:MAG: hypothetical protein ACRDHE_18160, partial [Ktedonobacterales bacterium]
TEQGVTTPFKVHSDSAPNIYITGNPARDATVTRTFDQALGKLTAVNPIIGRTDTITNYLADPVEMNLLHMITADPALTPTLTMFADPNYFLYAAGTTCSTSSPCVQVEPGFAWNHGTVSPDINTTWLGIVGPGVRHLGVNDAVWSDHTDIRPTMMMLLGLRDDYTHDGRALFEVVDSFALPRAARAHSETLLHLAQTYKQIDAAVGQLGLASLVISTRALESSSASDATYTTLENDLAGFTARRDALVARMNTLLEGVAFHGKAINEQQAKSLIEQGNALLNAVNALAGGKSK